jgi:hypothetical protein
MARPRNDDESGRTRSNRITLPLTADGSGIDFDSMRGTTKERLCDLMEANARDIYTQAGRPVPGDADPGEPGLDPFGGITLENIRGVLDIMGQANAMAVRLAGPRFLKHPFKRDKTTGKPLPLVIDPDILAQCFTLTDAQHAELDPRALRIAQKYSGHLPEWLKRHLDVYMLCGMYIKYTGENALLAMQTQIKRDVAVAQQSQRRQAKPQPGDSDTVQPNRITEADEQTGSQPDTFPPASPANGGMAAEL